MRFLRPSFFKPVFVSLTFPMALLADAENVESSQVQVYSSSDGQQTYVFDKGTLRSASEVMITTEAGGVIKRVSIPTGIERNVSDPTMLKSENIIGDLGPFHRNYIYGTKRVWRRVVEPWVAGYVLKGYDREFKYWYLEQQFDCGAGYAISGSINTAYKPIEKIELYSALISNLDKKFIELIQAKGLIPLPGPELMSERAIEQVEGKQVVKAGASMSARQAMARLGFTVAPTIESARNSKNKSEYFLSRFDFDYSFLSAVQPQPDELAELKAQIAELTARIEALEAQ